MNDQTNELRIASQRTDIPGDIHLMMNAAADKIDELQTVCDNSLQTIADVKTGWDKIQAQENVTEEALRKAEKGLVAIYRAFAPQANTEDGNLFADRDPVVIEVRSAIAKVARTIL